MGLKKECPVLKGAGPVFAFAFLSVIPVGNLFFR